jgi:hypothetical protein
VAVKVDKRLVAKALERAVRFADRNDGLPSEWVQRTEHIGESPSQTMVAFLGNALLARATYGVEIDPQSIKTRSGSRGYSTRGTVAVLVEGARAFVFDLGVGKREPLNNQPFFHANRVDRIPLEAVRPSTRPYLRALKKYLREIDSLNPTEAEQALAAFIVVRRRVAEEKRARAAEELKEQKISLARVGQMAASFVADRPESGRRGEAFAAAALDCVLPRVELDGVFDPDAFDVIAFRASDDEIPSLVVQVKQKVVDEDTAVELASASMEEGVAAALLLAMAAGQHPLNQQSIAARVERFGVTVLAVTSAVELLESLAVFSVKTPQEIALSLPGAFESRMRAIGCEEDAIDHWRELVAEMAEADLSK